MLLNAAPSRRAARALDSLWYLASAPQTLAALLALVAVTLAFAAVFPQSSIGYDAAATDRWLSTQSARFGGAAPILISLGAFNVLAGPWVALLLAALSLNIALRLAAQLRFLLRRAAAPPLPPAGLYPAQAAVDASLDHLSAAAETILRAEYGPAVVSREDARVQVFAQRRGPGAYGTAVAYAGALLVIVGLLLDATFGWRATGITLAQGRPMPLNPASGLRITLEGVAEGATPVAQLLLSAGDRTLPVSAGITRPGRWGNLLIAERAVGPALSVSARDGTDRPLTVQSLAAGGEVGERLTLLFDQTQNEQAFAIPTQDLTFRTVYYPSLPDQGLMRPVFQVEAYTAQEGAPAGSILVEDAAAGPGAELAVQNVRLAIRTDRYVDLDAAYLPGLAPLLLGSLLLLAGAALAAGWGMTRAWIDLTPTKDGVQVVVRMAVPVLPRERADRLLAQVIARAAHRGASTGAPTGAASAGDVAQPEALPGDASAGAARAAGPAAGRTTAGPRQDVA
jgi:hypothetical protein